ncbi:hypothetical protein BN133_569 [Cronobacter dublinensis 582]|nr:hypothetical protein BN133_569 [Cronobacter dublinensis 582]
MRQPHQTVKVDFACLHACSLAPKSRPGFNVDGSANVGLSSDAIGQAQ